MTIWCVLAAVALFGAASVAWYSGREWLAAALAGGVFVCVCIPSLFDKRTGERENTRWGHGDAKWSMSDAEFEGLVHAVDRSSGAGAVPTTEHGFDALVRDAIDELPVFVRNELSQNVAVLAVDGGDRPDVYGSAAHAVYGLYVGWTAGQPDEPARILLFRDTLSRDFPDPDALREQVVMTLRHEIAHHFGADEPRVRELGL